MSIHDSAFLLDLAEDLGIGLVQGEEELFEDATLLTFITKYREWSSRRDAALLAHLQAEPTAFRCYLPYSSTVFATAHEILWYLDEVIVRDPIDQWADDLDPANFESKKTNIRRTLQVLNLFRDALRSGFLLLAGPTVDPRLPQTAPPEIETLLQAGELVAELDKTVYFGRTLRPDSRGVDWILYQADLETGGILGWRGTDIIGQVASPPIQVGEKFPQVTPEQLSRELGFDIYDQARSLYPREVHRAIYSLAKASELGAAVLYTRPVDAMIVSAAAGGPIDPWRQITAIGSLRLALPYLQGASPAALMATRLANPEAFAEFRARMSSIIQKAIREDPVHAAEQAAIDVQREITPHLREMQAELSSISTKGKLLGAGLPAILATGVLAGAATGLGVQTLLPVALAGGIAIGLGSAQLADHAANVRRNPFWFLWEAQRS